MARKRQFAFLMLAVQLELFGAPPKPPAKIRQDEPDLHAVPATVDAAEVLPSNSVDVTDSNINHDEDVIVEAEQIETKQPLGIHVMMPGNNTFQQFVTIGLPQVNTPESEKPEKKEEVYSIPTNVGVEKVAKAIAETETPDTNKPTDNQPDLEAADSTELEPLQWIEPADLSANDYPRQILTADTTELKNEPAQQNEVNKPQKKGGKLEVADEKNLPDTLGSGVPDKETLHKRQYYTMRETADMFGVNQSLLRYWENEFTELRPRKNRKGDRYFRPQDIETLQLIFHLLKVRKFTIEGAKDYLKQNKKALDTFELIQKLEKLKIFLTEIRSNL